MRTVRKVVLAVGLSLFVVSHAEAAFIDLDFAVNLFGPHDANFEFVFFESAPTNLPYGLTGNEKVLAHGSRPMSAPGVTHFSLSLDVTDLSNFYFLGYGSSSHGPGDLSLFAASPPNGFDPATAWSVGPPWVPLANLLGPRELSGDLIIFNGTPNPVHLWQEGTYQVNVVPEPTSLLLLGTGLTMMLRRRQMKRRNSTG